MIAPKLATILHRRSLAIAPVRTNQFRTLTQKSQSATDRCPPLCRQSTAPFLFAACHDPFWEHEVVPASVRSISLHSESQILLSQQVVCRCRPKEPLFLYRYVKRCPFSFVQPFHHPRPLVGRNSVGGRKRAIGQGLVPFQAAFFVQ